VIARRRSHRARHEFRLGTRELLLVGLGLVAVCGLTFGLGVAVGRGLGGATGGPPPVAARPALDAEDGEGGSAAGKAAPVRAEEKLTFYRTLTAPTADLPPVGKPTIEERIVPREAVVAAPAASSPVSEATAEARGRTPGAPGRARPPVSGATRVAPSRPATVATATPPAIAAPPATPSPGDLPLWTIQVSSFRSRALAEELRARLATRGFEAYLLSAATEEGRVRYRVRVGSYQSRTDAERVAADLRGERALSPYVTTHTR
jgi:cell division protein FtsN